ncbi:sulfite exporter TauE/SafE family protein [Nakamurella deserti]|uniref:sulfite exporter TauE/SafE family protein n=1 Tax=Nakamurella deserti TaxID=2164074 RepID=UPI00197C6336|nr:sulfite exporter TauE/SafE family protein [Nakamurella deserti]
MSVLAFCFLVVAGIAGGLTGSIAGLASLATYSGLLAVGLSPIDANVTNTVALTFSTIGSVLGSRPELRGQGPFLRPLVPVAVLGGVLGGALLLSTPADGFEKVVPFLLGAAALTILIPRRRTDPAADAGPTRRHRVLQAVALGAIAVYGGYFGAAAGVLLLALLLHSTPLDLPRANAAKNVLLGAANLVAAAGFVVLAPVQWSAVVPLGIGCLIGARLGPAVVRRSPATVLRWLIGAAGLALAVHLGIRAFG